MRRRPMEALRALRELIRNPEDTGQVFVITRALSGDSIAVGCERFRRTAVGREVLATGRDIVPVLSDRAALARLPEGSLGRAYLALVERAGITADGLVAASEERAAEYATLTPEQACYARRLRDVHDLWHTVTGYNTDPFGEVCVVAFSYPQTRNLGLAAIAAIGALKIVRESRNVRILGAVWRAFRDGRRAAWLPAVDWEASLSKPLSSLREELRISRPTRYERLRGIARFDATQPA